jgi:hypothetical protein
MHIRHLHSRVHGQHGACSTVSDTIKIRCMTRNCPKNIKYLGKKTARTAKKQGKKKRWFQRVVTML